MNRKLFHAIAAALCVFTISASAASAPDPVQARKELTSMGLSYNSQDQFLSAIRKKDKIAINLFLAGKGIDLNSREEKSDETAFSIAYKAGDMEFAKYLLKLGAAPQPEDLVYAIMKDNRGFFQEMLSAPAFTKAVIVESVIWAAIHTEKRDVVEQLLQFVDDTNAAKAIYARTIIGMIVKPSLRDPVLIESALKRMGGNAKVMLNKTGLISMQRTNWMPYRPLNYAAVEDSKADIIPVLVKYGADVNGIDLITTRRGPSGGMEARVPETPLMTAVRRQNIPAISSLLKAGADPNQVIVQDTFGFFAISTHKVTALSYVEVIKSMRKNDKNFEQNQAEVVRLLKEAGAKTPDEIKG